jgi:hypothetical protein
LEFAAQPKDEHRSGWRPLSRLLSYGSGCPMNRHVSLEYFSCSLAAAGSLLFIAYVIVSPLWL